MIEWNYAMESMAENPQHAVYTLVGTELSLIHRFVKQLQSQLEKQTGGTSIDIHRFYYEETGVDAALAECQTVSLFSQESLIVLDNCVGLTAGARGKHDLTALEKYLESPVPEHTLVITCLAEKLDERKKAVKALKKFPVINCNTPKANEASKFLSALVREHGLRADREALGELWRRTESVTQAEREIEKLSSYTDGVIQLRDVAEITPVPLEDNVFRWIEGVIAGKLSLSFQALREIEISGYDGFALFSLLARQLRLMWFAKVYLAKGESQRDVARRVGAHPYSVKMAAEQAKNLSISRIEDLLCVIADTEFMVKSGRQALDQAIDWIVLRCGGAKEGNFGASVS
ncbi:DNA polymerase III subunit delta [Alicyclobacillus sp. SO9]|uniref:DNA polymerase III subunit delta n=1 Tax=Alicyclobacillus sp. SO9 TaxID=2665646 RepID=UPI0018E7DCE0|nr:DNA polymerase III subunit delta [Alicyclobacillus sp. SO9]QQE77353.1 DNA polymerase III subunit delta [Alicyclobacillus sp. SO9]